MTPITKLILRSAIYFIAGAAIATLLIAYVFGQDFQR